MFLFMEDYAFIFIALIITLAITVMLRAFWMTFLEVILVFLPVVIQNNEVMVPVLLIIQLVVTVWVLYKYYRAIEMNYYLVLEKTHQKSPMITENDNGSRFSFWNTK